MAFTTGFALPMLQPTRPSTTNWPVSTHRQPMVPDRRPSARVGTSTRNGSSRENGNGAVVTRVQSDRPRAPRPATANQIKAIQAIARRQDTDLVGLLRHEYEVERPEDLSIRQASELIDLLKERAEN